MTYYEGMRKAMQETNWTDEMVWERLGCRTDEESGRVGGGAQTIPPEEEDNFVAMVKELLNMVDDVWRVSPVRTHRTFSKLFKQMVQDPEI